MNSTSIDVDASAVFFVFVASSWNSSRIKSIRSFQRKWWIIQRLHAHYTRTHIFTEQYDDHDDFPIQAKHGATVTSFQTLKLFTQYILHQHIYSISPSTDVSKEFDVIWIYIYIFWSVKGDQRRKKLQTRSSFHFSENLLIRFRNEYMLERERLFVYPIRIQTRFCYVCWNWCQSVLSDWRDCSMKKTS